MRSSIVSRANPGWNDLVVAAGDAEPSAAAVERAAAQFADLTVINRCILVRGPTRQLARKTITALMAGSRDRVEAEAHWNWFRFARQKGSPTARDMESVCRRLAASIADSVENVAARIICSYDDGSAMDEPERIRFGGEFAVIAHGMRAGETAWCGDDIASITQPALFTDVVGKRGWELKFAIDPELSFRR